VIDNGTEFTSQVMDQWAYENQVQLHFITPGRPMENGFIESFNGKFRDECLNVKTGALPTGRLHHVDQDRWAKTAIDGYAFSIQAIHQRDYITGQTCALLLALASRRTSEPAAIRGDAEPDRAVADTDGIDSMVVQLRCGIVYCGLG
jgi:transposase InsO family protein